MTDVREGGVPLLSLLDQSWTEIYRAQLDAHPVSPIAVLRFRQQVVVARAERAL